MNEVKKGLEGVVASDSAICDIDGQRGRLIYAGYDIQDLADHASFEEVVFLLWNLRLPNEQELRNLCHELEENSLIPQEILDLLEQLTPRISPMGMLRTFVSMLAHFDPEAGERSAAANENKALRIVAKVPTLVAAYDRLRRGNRLIPFKGGQNLATRFLYQLTGHDPLPEAAKAFDVALILHAEHSLNASTFAARVVAATLSDIYSAVTAAMAALKGPLHGGANTEVISMLKEIGALKHARPYIEDQLAKKKRIFGFGHRVYKTMDPRAAHLKKMSAALAKARGNTKWYDLSIEIEKIMKEAKNLNPNVDFYSASAYQTLGIASDLFTAIFAISRAAGWTAHILEQYRDNRLIRPECQYVGVRDLKYIAIEKR